MGRERVFADIAPLCPSEPLCGIIAPVQKLLYATGGLFIALILIGLALPRQASVSVNTRIDAYPATVFALVNDFRRVALWSPLLDTDPNARIVFSGPPRGSDAAMTWDGSVIGSGSQVIVDSRPFDYVETVINPGEAGAARSWFEIAGADGATSVTWHFETDYGMNLVGRYFAPLLAGIVERDYARGLANLRELAESLPRVDFSDIEIERISVEAVRIAYLSTSSRPEPAAISEAMGDAYFEILNFIDRHGLAEAGAPLSITRSFTGSRLQFDAAIPVRGGTEETPRESSGVRIGMSYAGPVIRVRHVGSYRTLGRTHQKIAAYLAALGLERNGDAWESYVSDPTRVAEDELLTFVYYPVRG
jgi:effector-binding domain-containing protein